MARLARTARLSAGLAVALSSAAASDAASPARAARYRLPWPPGVAAYLTQDCNDTRYGDHVQQHGYAWDFAADSLLPVVAARGGVVVHAKQTSDRGCGDASCVDWANYVVIDHEDGTAGVYLHLAAGSFPASLRCGARVEQGDPLGTAGATGWATGVHLHFQVEQLPRTTARCECGEAGVACAADEVPWGAFWSTISRPALPIMFEEWDAARCADRAELLPLSHNARAVGGERLARTITRAKVSSPREEAAR